MTDLLQTVGLTKSYNRQTVVDEVSLDFHAGEIVGLLGPNGAGKTTTFLMIAGIVRPDTGKVLLNGEGVDDLPSHRRAEKGLLYLPQQHSIFTRATVRQNLIMVLELFHDRAESRRRADELLEEFGLTKVAGSLAMQLSGGEKRRLEIARAMIRSPRFLFLDEPFTGIDPITILDIQQVILALKQRGIGIVITDHNVQDTFFITDTVYILSQGRILSSGRPGEVVKEEQTRALFLGHDFAWRGEDG